MPEAHDNLQQSGSPGPRPTGTRWLRFEESYSDSGQLHLRLEGELDLASGEAVRERLRELQRAGTPTLLDLSTITFIDCSGLRVIVEALDQAGAHGGRLTLWGEFSAPVRRLLELTGHVSGSFPAEDQSLSLASWRGLPGGSGQDAEASAPWTRPAAG